MLTSEAKFHIILHLAESMIEFELTAPFNMIVDYIMHDVNVSFNSIMREYNIHGNKQAPSCDIATRIAITEHLQFLCHGGRTLMN